jgi:hypothetical protein
VLQDIRFVELLNRYGLKGTFNLNSELMEQEFEWIHESGMTVKRLGADVVRNLYNGHEIASHTLTHPYMHDKTDEQLLWEIGEDKRRLERLFGRDVAGFAVPFDYYSDKIARCVKNCGFEYGRMSEESRNYSPWQDPFYWKCGIFHLSPDLDRFIDGFFDTEEELALCQIVGHSYDLDAADLWGKMDAICRRVSQDQNVLPMTHIELVRYIREMDRAVMTDCFIQNNSDIDLWFRIGEQVWMLRPGERRAYGL